MFVVVSGVEGMVIVASSVVDPCVSDVAVPALIFASFIDAEMGVIVFIAILEVGIGAVVGRVVEVGEKVVSGTCVVAWICDPRKR